MRLDAKKRAGYCQCTTDQIMLQRDPELSSSNEKKKIWNVGRTSFKLRMFLKGTEKVNLHFNSSFS